MRKSESIYKTLVENALALTGERSLDEILADSHFTSYKDRLKKELTGFGPIEEHLRDDNVTEICINNFSQIFIEVNSKLFLSDLSFASEFTYQRFLDNLLLKINKVVDQRHPLTDGTLPCGTRVHISLPPITTNAVVTLRKHNVEKYNLEMLLKLKMFDQNFLDRLLSWINQKKNILFCGPTSSGKTTLLRATLMATPKNERIISIEDTSELLSIGPNHITLLTREDPENMVPKIDLSMLLKNSLRMRPDRLVVGEVRGVEAVILLDALATGHKGSFATIHGHDANHSLQRLESLILRANPKWDLMAIRQLIKDSVDVVVVCSKKNGLRVVSQAAEISAIENFGYLLDVTNLNH
ncbi:MAG: CpaF family protein [Oligoflexia bacterium]|nr:CpaF family protein [Oligoflexia bacterium]